MDLQYTTQTLSHVSIEARSPNRHLQLSNHASRNIFPRLARDLL